MTASSERFAPAIAAFWLWAAERSPLSVIVSTLAIIPALKSTMTSEKVPSGLSVYTESCNVPSSSSYLAESGVPWTELKPSPLSSGSQAPANSRARVSRSMAESGWAGAGNEISDRTVQVTTTAMLTMYRIIRASFVW